MSDERSNGGETDAGGRRDQVAAQAAALIAFQGVCHETVGAALFPYGPAVFGGASFHWSRYHRPNFGDVTPHMLQNVQSRSRFHLLRQNEKA